MAKRLSQELVVRDNVDILAGYVLTPNAMAAGDVSAEAKKFMVVMNAATSIIITKSPYMIRTSVVLPQVMETFGTWAATKGGVKQTYTMVTDYGPGHDSERAFQTGFKNAGGTIVGKTVCEDLCFSGGSHTSKPQPVRNPRKPMHSAGGSSSGSAAVIASLRERDPSRFRRESDLQRRLTAPVTI